jgi:hypothetical protein
MAASIAVTESVTLVALRDDPFRIWSLAETADSAFFAIVLASAFVLHLWSRPPLRELAYTIALAGVVAALHAGVRRLLSWEDAEPANLALSALGAASLLVLAVRAKRTEGAARSAALAAFVPALLLPCFVLSAQFYLATTALLHPMVLDPVLYAIDALPMGSPSFVVGRWFEASPPLRKICTSVYMGLPLALAFIHGAAQRRSRASLRDGLSAFVAAGAIGFLLYHLYPVAGPEFIAEGRFPTQPAAAASLPPGGISMLPVPRNCMPSLHTAWALLIYWQARPLGGRLRAFGAAWLVLTLLATLGLGYHYAVDLVVAVPFSVAVVALCTSETPEVSGARRRALWVGGAWTLGWILALRAFSRVLVAWRGITWILLLGSAAWAWMLERELARAVLAVEERRVDRSEGEPDGGLRRYVAVRELLAAHSLDLAALLSGVSAAIFALAVVRAISVDGETLTLPSGAVFLAASGIGVIGADRIARVNGRTWALTEIALAGVSLVSPWLVADGALAWIVLTLGGLCVGASWSAALRLGDADWARRAALIAFGGALGALVALVSFQVLGTQGTMMGATLPALFAVLIVLRARAGDAGPTGRMSRFELALPVTGLLAGAAFTLHFRLLATVAGDSAYELPLRLSVVLAGVGLGMIAARRLPSPWPALARWGLAIAVAGFLLLVSSRAWDAIPDYFGSFARYRITRSSSAREVVRLAVTAGMLLPVAVAWGTAGAWAVEAARGSRREPRLLALCLPSTAVGVLVAAFMVPRQGTWLSLLLVAGSAAVVGTVVFLFGKIGRAAAVSLAAACALAALAPRPFDFERFASGAHLHFESRGRGRLVGHRDTSTGLFAVVEYKDSSGRSLRVLSRDGVALGDDDAAGLDRIAASLGLSLLAPDARGHALLLGLRSGMAKDVGNAGFAHVDIVDPVWRELADPNFGMFEDGAFDRPHIHPHATGERAWLKSVPVSYDFVSIVPRDLSVSASAYAYTRELYALVRARLRPGGVVQTSFPVAYIPTGDLAILIGTARAAFPKVWVYAARGAAVLVLSDADGKQVGRSSDLLLLDPPGVDRFLEAGGVGEGIVATDDHPVVDFSGARGAARDARSSFEANVALLRAFAPREGAAERSISTPSLERSPSLTPE